MAQRRMLSKLITNSDAFLDMPKSSQALYMHLNVNADDDGFIDSPRMIMRMISAAEDDMRILIAKEFIIEFEGGLVVVKDWRIHNSIRKDRRKATIHTNEFNKLSVAENGSYTKVPIGRQIDNQVTTTGQPADGRLEVGELAEKPDETQYDNVPDGGCQDDNQVSTDCPLSIGKVSVVEDSIGKVSVGEGNTPTEETKPSVWEPMEFYQKVFSFPNMIVQEDMRHLCNEVGDDLVLFAMNITAKSEIRGKGVWNYIEAIVTDWKNHNVKTLPEAEQYQLDFAKRRARSNTGYNNRGKSSKTETLPGWVGEEFKETPVSAESEAFFKQQLADLRAKGANHANE